jgi:hypothetical protein
MTWEEIVRRFVIKAMVRKDNGEVLASHAFQISRECKIDTKGNNIWTTVPSSSIIIVREDKSIDWSSSEEFDKLYEIGTTRTMRAGDIKLGDED